ncbi:uncharacterized protein [Physcomitrium patens]|uniref:uncharacterized protein isoform X6 n=1 Tax=Physcomitrium patens TaxID=3218 RepID=UPI003CCD3703
MRNQGGGNPVENGVTFVSGSSTSESTDFVITSDEASQSETPLRANAVVERYAEQLRRGNLVVRGEESREECLRRGEV